MALRLYQLGIAVPGVVGLSAREALEVVEPPVDDLSRVAVLRNNLVDALSYVLRAEQELVGVLVAELESEPLAAH